MAREWITQNTGVTIRPTAAGSGNRNCLSRVFVGDGEAFEVILRVGPEETLVASGTGVAPTGGKLCAVYIKTRGEADVDPPGEEEPETR